MSVQESLPTIPSKPLPYLTQESVILSCVPCYPLECPKRASLLLSRKLLNLPPSKYLTLFTLRFWGLTYSWGGMVKGWELRDPLDLCVRAPQNVRTNHKLPWKVSMGGWGQRICMSGGLVRFWGRKAGHTPRELDLTRPRVPAERFGTSRSILHIVSA